MTLTIHCRIKCWNLMQPPLKMFMSSFPIASPFHVKPQGISWPKKESYCFPHLLITWVLRLSLDLYVLSQNWQGKLSPSIWISTCSFIWPFALSVLPHVIHFHTPSTFSIIFSIVWSISSIFWWLVEIRNLEMIFSCP